jgi:hypothetical protein
MHPYASEDSLELIQDMYISIYNSFKIYQWHDNLRWSVLNTEINLSHSRQHILIISVRGGKI